ncbi:helix-turn-helix transcriptional regulator [Paraburkholderia bryophila]
MLDETFERPLTFDLATYWQDSTRRLSEELYANEATLRLSPWGVQMLEAFTSPFARAAATIGEPDPVDGWRTVTLPVGSTRQACAEFLRFGSEAEVLAPLELREKIAEVVAALHRRYGQ